MPTRRGLDSIEDTSIYQTAFNIPSTAICSGSLVFPKSENKGSKTEFWVLPTGDAIDTYKNRVSFIGVHFTKYHV